MLFLIFGLFPLLFTFYVALFDWDPIGEKHYIGLENLTQLAHDPRFWGALRNTFSIWVLSTVPQLLLALVVAHVLNHVRLRAATLLRMSVLVPYITSVAATTIVFAQLFDRDYGMLNWLLGLLGWQHFDFTASIWGSHVMIAAMVMWRWTGYNTLLYLASLQAVPRELYEAAAADGANGWKQFRHISIPSLRPISAIEARSGADLLDPSAWTKANTPMLSTGSNFSNWGPGHNTFSRDEDGLEIVVFHAHPTVTTRGRCSAVRRIHWAADGHLVLDQRPDEEVAPRLRRVSAIVRCRPAEAADQIDGAG